MRTQTTIPEGMPQLSAGSHRSARQGACFMEFASYLAGERWSDHPRCTDPVLAQLARGVNDGMSDGRRGELVELIPRVVSLRGDDRRVGSAVALRAALAALPVASMGRQRALAAGVLGMLDEGVVAGDLVAEAAAALRTVPDAEAWAGRFVATQRHGPIASPVRLRALAGLAAAGIADACIPDPDTLLRTTLERAIVVAEALIRVEGCQERTSPAVKPRSARSSSPSTRTPSPSI